MLKRRKTLKSLKRYFSIFSSTPPNLFLVFNLCFDIEPFCFNFIFAVEMCFMFTLLLQEARLDMTKISLKQIWDVYSAVIARYCDKFYVKLTDLIGLSVLLRGTEIYKGHPLFAISHYQSFCDHSRNFSSVNSKFCMKCLRN